MYARDPNIAEILIWTGDEINLKKYYLSLANKYKTIKLLLTSGVFSNNPEIQRLLEN